jgi:FAD/FMN-containing dehydrogenase
MPTRRKALGAVAQAAAGLALLPLAPRRAQSSVLVNDIHSQLNPTRVDRIVAVDSEATLRAALAAARAEGKPVCLAGGRHAMGGQQFGEDAVLLDMRSMRRIVGLDSEQGVVEAEAGIQWPELIERLIAMQQGQPAAWGIIQKQTGADRLTLGGALGANIHGRGLALKPIIGDVESFTLMHADGSLSTCSRSENRALFGLAIGGYGLFGVVTRVRLRLRRRIKLERVVRIIDIDDLMPAFAERIGEGYLYGDCQFSTDASSETYLRKGVFACYRPLPADAAIPAEEKELGEAQWRELYRHSHADTRRLRSLYVVLSVDLGSALLVRPQPTRRLYRRLPRRTRSSARQPVQGQRK